MPRTKARFRISIKDHHTKTSLRVELIDAIGLWGERRYRILLNGQPAERIKEATLTEVFDQLRRWMVRRA